MARLVPGPTALYGQLGSILRSRIIAGEWKEGQAIPTLREICEEYQVARVTARQAVQSLAHEGLLSSHRGRRTYVTRQGELEGNGRPLFLSIGAADSTVNDFTVEILSTTRVDALPPGCFLGRPAERYVRFLKVEKENGRPYCHSEVCVADHVFDRIPKGLEKREKLARLVRDFAVPPIVRAAERLRVAAADYTDASLLNCNMSFPVARVRRVFCDETDRVIYFALSTYSGERFEVQHDLLAYITGETAPEAQAGYDLRSDAAVGGG